MKFVLIVQTVCLQAMNYCSAFQLQHLYTAQVLSNLKIMHYYQIKQPQQHNCKDKNFI
ncbi:asb015 [Agrotis segetum nucleopolyhedrovirus B]|uniref:Asb015 n=1 Tax=Agrotis segetum nucleopolyhedrovirus B TaxID=1580580 RepID=A0A0A7KR40_9ABAC|nr:asb015 [Agrotis segetum nucleopolyhedrovirus B]AIZ48573.1 asb015 [Agrotis segetum nucleopolyhedrovirus B]